MTIFFERFDSRSSEYFHIFIIFIFGPKYLLFYNMQSP